MDTFFPMCNTKSNSNTITNENEVPTLLFFGIIFQGTTKAQKLYNNYYFKKIIIK